MNAIFLIILSLILVCERKCVGAFEISRTTPHRFQFNWRPHGFTSLKSALDPERHGGDRRQSEFNLLESSHDSSQSLEGARSGLSDYHEQWGFVRDEVKEMPCTAVDVAKEAFRAVAGTLHKKQKLDPNVANNARSRSVVSQRPVRRDSDAGRIGLEIDGAEFLFPDKPLMTSGAAVRRFSLLLAANLASGELWKDFESDDAEESLGDRPVALCYSTIKQAISASHELKQLRLEQSSEKYWKHFDEKIKIQCLADGIPEEMMLDKNERRRYGGLADGFVNVTKGILVVIQPTDYNMEYPPPGPAFGALSDFQSMVAKASVEEIPVIVISPRFMSAETIYDSGWDQSGYQQASTYGGFEPPKGPTPWIMRDFTPPSFCWIGEALRLGRPPRAQDEDHEKCFLTRVALTQTVMDVAHSWHIYAAKDCVHGRQRKSTSYIQLGSTLSSSGRPTRAMLRQLVENFYFY